MSPLPLATRQKYFAQLVDNVQEEIVTEHQEDLVYCVGGYLKNQINAFLDKTWISKLATLAGGAAKLGTMFIPKSLGLLGPAVNKIVADGSRALQAGVLRWKAGRLNAVDVKLTGEWVVVKGAEAFRDAVRKIDDVSQRYAALGPAKNCSDFYKQAKTLYYWNYRLIRLRYYKNALQNYLDAVEEKLNAAEANWNQEIAQFDKFGQDLIGDLNWHLAHCKDSETCSFPWRELHGLSEAEIDALRRGELMIKRVPPPPASNVVVKRAPPPPVAAGNPIANRPPLIVKRPPPPPNPALPKK